MADSASRRCLAEMPSDLLSFDGRDSDAVDLDELLLWIDDKNFFFDRFVEADETTELKTPDSFNACITTCILPQMYIIFYNWLAKNSTFQDLCLEFCIMNCRVCSYHWWIDASQNTLPKEFRLHVFVTPHNVFTVPTQGRLLFDQDQIFL